MLSLEDYCKQLLYGTSLEEKLTVQKNLSFNSFDAYEMKDPGRPTRLKFSAEQIKFPKKTSFHLDEKKALAIHFFANHELLAIEMFAQALLMFPNIDQVTAKNLLATIEDEQNHLKLYITRMNELGIEFGDYPVNDFFWDYMGEVKTFEEFYALMALTFEQANLDFAKYYQNIFKEVGDEETFNVLDQVYKDEIAHVARGAKYLKSQVKDQDLFSYYQSLLPGNISPSRGKGMIFDERGRQLAGLDHHFINQMNNFRDDFDIVNRKQWKK